MAAQEDFKDDLVEKLKELGWWVAVALVRWLLEYLARSDASKESGRAEAEHE